MRKLDKVARRYELGNASKLLSGLPQELDKPEQLDSCAELMMTEDLRDERQLAYIKRVAKVADSYVAGNRIAGVYPISSLFVKRGVRRLQGKLKQAFLSATESADISGTLVTYAPNELAVISESFSSPSQRQMES